MGMELASRATAAGLSASTSRKLTCSGALLTEKWTLALTSSASVTEQKLRAIKAALLQAQGERKMEFPIHGRPFGKLRTLSARGRPPAWTRGRVRVMPYRFSSIA